MTLAASFSQLPPQKDSQIFFKEYSLNISLSLLSQDCSISWFSRLLDQ